MRLVYVILIFRIKQLERTLSKTQGSIDTSEVLHIPPIIPRPRKKIQKQILLECFSQRTYDRDGGNFRGHCAKFIELVTRRNG